MKTFFVFLLRNKLYTAINVIGLAISLAFVFLIASYTVKQLQTDKFQEHADRVYLLGNKRGHGHTYYWLQRLMAERYPEIECAISLDADRLEVTSHEHQTSTQEICMLADSAYFDMLTHRILEGDVRKFKDGRRHCVVSQSYARRIFGKESPIGAELAVKYNAKEFRFIVAAIMEDIDNSFLPEANLIVPAEDLMLSQWGNGPELDLNGACYTLVKVHEGADIHAKCDEMEAWFKEILWSYRRGMAEQVRFVPIDELYFAQSFRNNKRSHFHAGDREFVSVLITVGVVLLIFALLNYVNLTMAQSGFRAKEMAMRRLLGTRRSAIFMRLIAESLILCVGAALLALLLAYALLPQACDLLRYQFGLFDSFTAMHCLLLVGCVLLIGLSAGVFPALFISGFSPMDVVKGTFRTKSKSVYGRVMIGIQYTLAIVMLVMASTIHLQMRHIIEAPLGYNTKDYMTVNLRGYKGMNPLALRAKLMTCPQVEKVGFGTGHPYYVDMFNTPVTYQGQTLSMMQIYGDSLYFDILDLRVKHDNKLGEFAPFLNEWAIEFFGMKDTDVMTPEDEHNDPFPVGGVYYNFHFRNVLANKRGARIYNFGNRIPGILQTAVIKTVGPHEEARQAVIGVFKELYPGEIELTAETTRYVEDSIANGLSKERRLLQIVGIFTLLSIFVATLGLLGMSTYYVRQRRGDIAIMRVYGTSRLRIVSNLIGRFLLIVAIAFVVALPIAFHITEQWLSDYAYRIAQSGWLYVLVGLFVVVIAFLTVLGLSVRAANANPVEVLRKG